MTSGLPILNSAAALDRIGGSGALYQKMIALFLKDYVDYADRVRKLYASGDLKGAAELAHAMKGMAGNLGGERLQEVSRRLQIALQENPDESASLVALFAGEMMEFIAAIEAYGNP